MKTFSEFAKAEPALSEFGRQRFEGRIAYLATIRNDGSPRVHPVAPLIAGDLFVYMEPTSPKAHDLRRDQRYAMNCAVEDSSGGQGEFLVSGEATEVHDASTRAHVFEQARARGYFPLERYVLFELRIEAAMSTVYEGDAPKRVKWTDK